MNEPTAVTPSTQSLKLGPSTHIPLRDAHLCVNCDSIGNNASYCPACSDTHLIPMSSVVKAVNQ